MSPDSPIIAPELAAPTSPSLSRADRYRAALESLPAAELATILGDLGTFDRLTRPRELAAAVIQRLEDVRFVEDLIGRLGEGSRFALGLFALVDAPSWPRSGMDHAMAAVGMASPSVLEELRRFGLVVMARETEASPQVIVPNPGVLPSARTVLPGGEPPPSSTTIRHVRETDGLEPILRLAALWQKVDDAALRRTQQGTLYKKDRERIEDDSVLGGPIADSLEPLPDMGPLWLALARTIGLVIDEANSDRTVAAPAEYWAENAVHLPQMVASAWLGLRGWHEVGGIQSEGATATLATPFLRPSVLLWLAKLEPGAWVAIDDLAEHLDAVYPSWPFTLLGGTGSTTMEPRDKSGTRRSVQAPSEEARPGGAWLEAMLMGASYQFGLVRAAEDDPSGRRVVQITELGRYALALGPPPPGRETFEDFLFIQPNFELIAYRQGLNPSRIGQLSRFMTWTHSGAALEMKLTAESVYRGLEGGLDPDAMLARLARHSSRPLPSGVAEALRTWSSRRDRVTYHTSATLIEFITAEALEEALKLWEGQGGIAPSRVADRLLLVEDESSIPFQKFRLAGSRDYRRPPEPCVEVEPDGVTLALNLSRSDLFIDAELLRMAEEIPSSRAGGPPSRSFRITAGSLRAAVEDGLTPASLGRWFEQRVGAEMPPAVRLLLHAAGPSPKAPRIGRPTVLTSPTVDLLDGLLQHPSTRHFLGERLGPTAVIVPDDRLEPLRKALAAFGLDLI